jgi:hypothetical protein
MAKDGKIRWGQEGWVMAPHSNRPHLPLLRSILWAPDDKNFPPVKDSIVPGLKKTHLSSFDTEKPARRLIPFRSRIHALLPPISISSFMGSVKEKSCRGRISFPRKKGCSHGFLTG